MFLIIFTRPVIKELGNIGGSRVFMTAQQLYIFFIPTFCWGREYFAEDSSGRVFVLSEEAGKAIRRGEKDSILPQDIAGEADSAGSVYEQYAYGRERSYSVRTRKCPYCGFTTTENYNYCPKCAEKLDIIE